MTMQLSDDDQAYLKQCLDLAPEQIREEFIRTPADMAYWGEKYALTFHAYLLAEQGRKQAYARCRLSIRETKAAAGQKVTEGDLDAWVELDSGYQAAKLAEVTAEAEKLAAKLRLDAVVTKKDMTVSLGAHIRSEMGGIDPMIKRDR